MNSTILSRFGAQVRSANFLLFVILFFLFEMNISFRLHSRVVGKASRKAFWHASNKRNSPRIKDCIFFQVQEPRYFLEEIQDLQNMHHALQYTAHIGKTQTPNQDEDYDEEVGLMANYATKVFYSAESNMVSSVIFHILSFNFWELNFFNSTPIICS